MRKVRKLRHWKQRFDKGAEFIWRKAVTWQGKAVKLGTPIPVSLKNNRAKLRRFWEAHVIELAEFEEPQNVLTGKAEAPVEPEVPLGPSEPVEHVDVHGEQVPIGEVIALALEDFGGTVSEWNALEWLDREKRMQDVVEMMLDQDPEDAPREPEGLLSKGADRKWRVEGLDEVFTSKTKALEAAKAHLAEDDFLE